MALRKPLVVGADGLSQQLQAGDTVGANAFFVTPATALPTLTALGSSTLVMSVTPAAVGDNLAKGEVITVVPDSALPGGLNVAYVLASALNQITIGFSAVVSITGSNRTWTVVAHR